MNNRNAWILALFFLLLVPVVFFTVRTLEWMIPNFPGMFFGQIQLTRDSAPLSPRPYQSAEFILGQVDYAQINSSSYIYLQDDVLFWDPLYPGFPQTKLNLDEVRQIQAFLAGGMVIKQNYPEEGFSCLEISAGEEPEWLPCPNGESYWDQFNDFRFEASRTRDVGLLLIQLNGGRIVEIRISPGENGLAFESTEKTGPWWIDGVVDQPFSLLEDLAARAEVEPIDVLWPRLTEKQANAKAQRILGNRYRKALEVVQNSSEVEVVFGTIEEIRPALGNNSYSSWMDSSCATMTFYLAGTKGEGVVLAQGEDCFDIRMVVDGVPVQNTVRNECP